MNEKITPLPWALMEEGFSRKHPVPTIYATDDELRYIAFFADSVNMEPTPNLENARYALKAANTYPALTARVKELEEALAEAIGWNWLDGDVPQGIQDKCCDPLNKEPTT